MRASLRPRFYGTLVAGVAFALVLGSTGVVAPDAAAAFGVSSAITRVSGDVIVRHAGGDFAAAHEGDVVAAGDAIRTARDSSAEITYFDGSTLELEADTEIVVDTLATASDGGTVIAMSQVIGRTWHVVTKLISGSSRYEVRTPTSTASVRGTIFAVDVDPEDATTTVTTREGIVLHIGAEGGPRDAVRVGAGEQSTKAKSAKAPERAEPAAPEVLREAPSRPANTHAVANVATLVAPSSPHAQDATRAHEDKRAIVDTANVRDRTRQPQRGRERR